MWGNIFQADAMESGKTQRWERGVIPGNHETSMDRPGNTGAGENGRYTWKNMMGKDQGHLGSSLGDTLPSASFPLPKTI